MKRMFKILLLVSVVLVGCRSAKQVTSTKTQISELVKNDIQTSTDSVGQVHVIASRAENVAENDSIVVTETIVELSKPDSTGNQYPERITHRETSQVKKTEKQTAAASDSVAVTNKHETKADNSDKLFDTNTQEETTIKKGHNRTAWIIIGLGLVAAAFFILKRYAPSGWLAGVIKRILKFASI